MNSERKKVLQAFQKASGLKFKSTDLLNLAFTHRSSCNESGRRDNNERLEFLGDSVLGAVASSLLYERLPEKSEGELAKIKSVVVSEEILSGIALENGIDGVLVLGKGEEQTGGRTKKAILADALEALIGAVYLDSGFKEAWNFVARRIGPEIKKVLENRSPQDYKSLLQEYSQRLYKTYPAYSLVKRSGPEHDRLFFIKVTVNGESYGPCTGRSKKAAEQEAARAAWEKLAPP
ncbi:MAG: ribonuclease III [Treponema sp.]|nr:ribonuclease III [Treponema sp.]